MGDENSVHDFSNNGLPAHPEDVRPLEATHLCRIRAGFRHTNYFHN